MSKLHELLDEIEAYADAGAHLLLTLDDCCNAADDRVAEARGELTMAKRAARTFSEASPAWRPIGQTIAKQTAEVEQQFEAARDEASAARAVRARVAKSIELLKQAIGSTSFASTAQVRPVVRQLLKDNGALTYKDLYDLVFEHFKSKQVSGIGLALRVRECLTDPEVIADDQGRYRLAEQEAASRAVVSLIK